MTAPAANPPPASGPDESSIGRGPRHRAGRVLLYVSVGGGLMALMIVAASSLLHSGVSPKQLQSQASAIRVWGAAIQSLLACGLLLLWPRWVAWAAQRGIVADHERQAVLRLRARLATFLMAYLGLVAFGPANVLAFIRFLFHRLG